MSYSAPRKKETRYKGLAVYLKGSAWIKRHSNTFCRLSYMFDSFSLLTAILVKVSLCIAVSRPLLSFSPPYLGNNLSIVSPT